MQGTDRPCSITGCSGSANPYMGGARGWCQAHYARWRRHGDPLHGGPIAERPPTGGPCGHCAKPSVARGLCENHYRRWKRCGDPLGGHASPNVDPAVTFWARVAKNAECWEWQGAPNGAGYGTFNSNGRRDMAHRWAWTLAGRSLTPGLELDHLCRNRICVRPDHLEEVTSAENKARAQLLT